MDRIVCVGVLTFKNHGSQKEKWGVGVGVGGCQNLLKANDGSLHGRKGLVFIALHSEGWR